MFQPEEKFSTSFLVSDAVYNGFVTVFKDTNPLHTDEAFAKQKGFYGKVMHGNILNGFLSFFIGECLPEKNVIIHSQEIQFKNPVYLNDTVHLNAVVSGLYESVGVVEFKFDFRNMENKVVAKGKIQIGLLP